MRSEGMEVIEQTSKKIQDIIVELRGKINWLAILPGGAISDEVAAKIDSTAEESKTLLADIDLSLVVMIGVLRTLG